MKKRKNVIIAIMICAALVMATGYAYFSTRLNINATGNITSNWNVYFSKITNGTIVGSASNNTTPSITSTTANIDVNLQLPGDSITYELTLTNGGSVGAIIEDIEAEAVGSTAIIYSISGIKIGDKIAGGDSKVITIKVEYDPNFTSQPAITTKTLTVTIDAVQDIGQTITEGNINIQEKTLAAAILKNSTVNGVVPVRESFDKRSNTADPTFYQAVDGDGVTYYFRGMPKNYVKFGKWESDYSEIRGYKAADNVREYKKYSTLDECNAAATYNFNCAEVEVANAGDDMYWRIVRINGDGTIRLLYDGTSAVADKLAHVSTIGVSEFSLEKDSEKGTYYSYSENGVQVDSTIKTFLETWYKNNLYNKYHKYIADTVFCGDKQISKTTYYDADDNVVLSLDSATQYVITYAAKTRLKTNKNPELYCSYPEGRYTVNSAKGNGLLKYPVGLMSADEVQMAGGILITANQNYYLYSNEHMWLFTPYDFGSNTDGTEGDPENFVTWDGGHMGNGNVDNQYGVRPVINLNADVKIASGDGSVGAPYVIELN